MDKWRNGIAHIKSLLDMGTKPLVSSISLVIFLGKENRSISTALLHWQTTHIQWKSHCVDIKVTGYRWLRKLMRIMKFILYYRGIQLRSGRCKLSMSRPLWMFNVADVHCCNQTFDLAVVSVRIQNALYRQGFTTTYTQFGVFIQQWYS